MDYFKNDSFVEETIVSDTEKNLVTAEQEVLSQTNKQLQLKM